MAKRVIITEQRVWISLLERWGWTPSLVSFVSPSIRSKVCFNPPVLNKFVIIFRVICNYFYITPGTQYNFFIPLPILLITIFHTIILDLELTGVLINIMQLS